jgi:hypothetical protein
MIAVFFALVGGTGNQYSDYFAKLQPTDFRSVRAISFSTPEPSGDAGFPTGMVKDSEPDIKKRIPANKWLARLIIASDGSSDKFFRMRNRIVIDLVDGNRLLVASDGAAQLQLKARPKFPATFKLKAGDQEIFAAEVESALHPRD